MESIPTFQIDCCQSLMRNMYVKYNHMLLFLFCCCFDGVQYGFKNLEFFEILQLFLCFLYQFSNHNGKTARALNKNVCKRKAHLFLKVLEMCIMQLIQMRSCQTLILMILLLLPHPSISVMRQLKGLEKESKFVYVLFLFRR